MSWCCRLTYTPYINKSTYKYICTFIVKNKTTITETMKIQCNIMTCYINVYHKQYLFHIHSLIINMYNIHLFYFFKEGACFCKSTRLIVNCDLLTSTSIEVNHLKVLKIKTTSLNLFFFK